jgi:glutamine cyclotransferase
MYLRSKKTVFFLAGSILFCCSPNNKKKDSISQDEPIAFSVVKVFPHDKRAFTQGLVIDQGKLFESTGRENSWIAEAEITSGHQEKKVVLDKKYFGEGITIFHNKLYQLTWQNHIGFIYDLKTFHQKGQFKIAYEGWGITHDLKNLIVSDGTETLHFLDTASLEEKAEIKVHDRRGPVRELNELEFIEGYVFANQWETNFIYKIDPVTGNVAGKLDLTPLSDNIKMVDPYADVLNGIAYEKKSKTLLVTGKLWPSLFALRIK